MAKGLFGDVDASKPHTIITVNEACRIMCMRRASLAPGVYLVTGDARGKFDSHRERRMMQAGIYSVAFNDGAHIEEKVSAQTQSEVPLNMDDLLASSEVEEMLSTEEIWSNPNHVNPHIPADHYEIPTPPPIEPDYAPVTPDEAAPATTDEVEIVVEETESDQAVDQVTPEAPQEEEAPTMIDHDRPVLGAEAPKKRRRRRS